MVQQGKNDYGFNAQREKYENLLAATIIDPAKVVRFALLNAASLAGVMLTTEAMVAIEPEQKKGNPPPSGGMDEDMY